MLHLVLVDIPVRSLYALKHPRGVHQKLDKSLESLFFFIGDNGVISDTRLKRLVLLHARDLVQRVASLVYPAQMTKQTLLIAGREYAGRDILELVAQIALDFFLTTSFERHAVVAMLLGQDIEKSRGRGIASALLSWASLGFFLELLPSAQRVAQMVFERSLRHIQFSFYVC